MKRVLLILMTVLLGCGLAWGETLTFSGKLNIQGGGSLPADIHLSFGFSYYGGTVEINGSNYTASVDNVYLSEYFATTFKFALGGQYAWSDPSDCSPDWFFVDANGNEVNPYEVEISSGYTHILDLTIKPKTKKDITVSGAITINGDVTPSGIKLLMGNAGYPSSLQEFDLSAATYSATLKEGEILFALGATGESGFLSDDNSNLSSDWFFVNGTRSVNPLAVEASEDLTQDLVIKQKTGVTLTGSLTQSVKYEPDWALGTKVFLTDGTTIWESSLEMFFSPEVHLQYTFEDVQPGTYMLSNYSTLQVSSGAPPSVLVAESQVTVAKADVTHDLVAAVDNSMAKVRFKPFANNVPHPVYNYPTKVYLDAEVAVTKNTNKASSKANSSFGCESNCGGDGEPAELYMQKNTSYTLVVRAKGYKTYTDENYTVSSESYGYTIIEMQAGNDDDEPTATVIGKVLNGGTSNKECFGAYENVTVTLSNADESFKKTSPIKYDYNTFESLGGECYSGYKFDTVPLGEYTLTYAKDGYDTETQTINLTEEKVYKADPVTLEWSPEDFEFTGQLSYQHALDGTVLLNNAVITAYADAAQTQQLATTSSDASGNWTLTVHVRRSGKVYFSFTHDKIYPCTAEKEAAYNSQGTKVPLTVSPQIVEKQPEKLGLASCSLQQTGNKVSPKVKISWTYPQELIDNYRTSTGGGTYSIEKIKVSRRIEDNTLIEIGSVAADNNHTLPATSFMDENDREGDYKFSFGDKVTYQLDIVYKYPTGTYSVSDGPNLTITLSLDKAPLDTFDIEVAANNADWGTVTGGGRYEEGKTASVSATANDGFVFVGWNENGSQVSDANPYTFTITGNRTLTAVFKYDTVELTLQRNDNAMGTVTGAGKYRKNQQVTATATANDGYKFVGWNENGAQVSAANPYTFTITGNRTLTAVFKYDTVTLTLQRNDNAMGTVTGGGKYRKNQQVTATATANDGYKFVGWNENGAQVSDANPYTFNITGNRTLTAVFKYDTVELTLQRNDANMGTVTGAGKYRKNQQVTATATANDGYKFVNWKEGNTQASAANPYTFKITGNRTLTAVFKYDTVTLTLQRNDADMGTVAGGGKYRKNQSVKITATPEENHVFVAWKEGETVVSIENPYTFNITANRTFKAFFQPDSVTLGLSVGTPGRGTVEGAAKYQKGEEVSISAIADYAAGFVFDVWKNGEEVFSQEADTTFLITQNMNLAAYFKYDSVDLALSPNDPRMGTVSGAGSYRRGQSVEIKAIPNTGYRWKEWRENDTVVRRAAAATHTFTIQRNRNLVAVFVPDSVTLNLGVNDVAMGSVSGNGRYKRGATARVKATPNTNYVFVKWEEQDTTVIASATGLAAGAEFTTKQLYNDRTLKAVFKRDSAVLTVKPNNAELGSATGGGKFAKGQSVTVTATAIGDNEFLGWRKNNGETVNTDASYTFTFTGTLTLTAYFKVPDPDSSMLTLTVNDADMGTADARGQVGGAKFEAGETVEITATPNAGYKFMEWQESGTQLSTENPCEVEIAANHDRTITAVFAVKPDSVDLTLRVNNEDWGVVEGEGRYQKGESVVVTASPSEDRVFVGWKDNSGQVKSTEETYRFNIESDLTLTAYFQPDSMDLALEVNEARMGTVKGKGRYEKGKEVTITATPNDGYAFVEWKNGAEQFSDEREHTFEIDENLTLTAYFQPDSAMLNLDVDDPAMGKVTGAGRYRRGTKVKITATPDTGYKFVAWKEGETVISTNAAHTTKELTADRSLKAYFAADPVELTLTVDDAAAGTVQGEGTYLRNKPVVIKAIANPGYRFVAWEEEDGNEFATEAEYRFNIKKTRTLKAVFVKQVTLTLTPDNPDRGTVDGAGTYDKDASATATATPKEGYEFVGWQEDGEIVSNDAEYTFAMEGNRTLTAIFAEKKVRLTLNANHDDWGSVEGEDTYGKGASATAKAIPNDDYVFKGWQEDGKIVSTEAEYTFIINADRTLTAIFAEKPVVEQVRLTLEVNNADWGTVEGADTYDKGTPVTAKATPNEGYEFKGWQENGAIVSTDAEYNFTIETDRTLTAIFAEKAPVPVEQVTLALEPNNADWGTVEGAGKFDKGTPVTAKAVANEGYEFKGWEEDGETVSTDAEYNFTIETDRTLVAVFEKQTPPEPPVVEEQVTLALEVNNADWGTVEGAGTFDKGTPVTAKAVAKEGYEFRAWLEGGEVVFTDAEYTFTLNADRTLTAVFVEIQQPPVVKDSVTLTLEVNDAVMGTVTGAGKYEKGTKVTALAVANKGYVFEAWKEGEIMVSTEAEYTFTLEANLTLTAVFFKELANEDIEQAAWSVYTDNRTIVLRSEAACRYDIYTVSGKKIGQVRSDGKECRMTVKNGGLYVVRCTTAGGMTTKKVVVR